MQVHASAGLFMGCFMRSLHMLPLLGIAEMDVDLRKDVHCLRDYAEDGNRVYHLPPPS